MATRLRSADSGGGYYKTVDVHDEHGEPYTIERCSWATGFNSNRPLWAVTDSKGNLIGQYPSRRDAARSLDR